MSEQIIALIRQYTLEMEGLQEDLNLIRSYAGPDPDPSLTTKKEEKIKWLKKSITDLKDAARK